MEIMQEAMVEKVRVIGTQQDDLIKNIDETTIEELRSENSKLRADIASTKQDISTVIEQLNTRTKQLGRLHAY